jgi:23S rRNA (uracil1939-C5)-methyltransferase
MSRKKQQERVYETLSIQSMGNEGVSIARNEEGIVRFLKYGAPGDLVHAEIRQKRKKFAEGIIQKVIEPSPDRIEPRCEYFTHCGGCSWQHLKYEQQLHWKRQIVEDVCTRIGKFPFPEIESTLPSPRQFNYRNKMEFSFGSSAWLTEEQIASNEDFRKGFAFGLHVPGRFDKIMNIEECHLQCTDGNILLDAIHTKAHELELSGYDPRSHEGFLRSLIIRSSKHSSEIMAILITQEPNSEQDEAFIDWWHTIRSAFPFITSALHCINLSWSPMAQGEIVFSDGPLYITESILDIRYTISPFSFFQTNSYQLDQFVARIIDQAQIDSNAHVWDLYCGAGTITFPAAKKAHSIIGIELSESSIANAKYNQSLNNIHNSEFYAHDLHVGSAIELLKSLKQPDIIIIDPPRAGVHDTLLRHMLEISPKRIVYVSCNPATQARDIAILSEKYEVTSMIPVDMFPQTAHVESIGTLELKSL